MSHSAGESNSKITREYVIRNRYGIHARPAAMLVKTASKFQSDVTVEKGSVRVSGKSIMGLMTMEASCGAKIKIMADGVDAEQALDEIERLFENKFYEE